MDPRFVQTDLSEVQRLPDLFAVLRGVIGQRAAAPAVEARFYRTAQGGDADLVLRFRDGETWVVEIRRSSTPTVSKGFHLVAAEVGATRKLLVAPVATAYPLRDGVEVTPLLDAVRDVSLRQP